MKLTKIEPKYKSKYVIEVKFMHGDADAYTTEDCVCKDEQEFKDILSRLKGPRPTPPAEGGNEEEYRAWGEEVFGDSLIPYDVSGYDCSATYNDHKLFYYDENGVKFSVEL